MSLAKFAKDVPKASFWWTTSAVTELAWRESTHRSIIQLLLLRTKKRCLEELKLKDFKDLSQLFPRTPLKQEKNMRSLTQEVKGMTKFLDTLSIFRLEIRSTWPLQTSTSSLLNVNSFQLQSKEKKMLMKLSWTSKIFMEILSMNQDTNSFMRSLDLNFMNMNSQECQ